MELRKEYAEIVEQVVDAHGWLNESQVRRSMNRVALACQELADRPPRELTDAEIIEAYAKAAGVSASQLFLNKRVVALRAVIAAFLAKQREPQVVKFRAARRKSDGIVQLIPASTGVNHLWEWLDADGKAQEFEVKV